MFDSLRRRAAGWLERSAIFGISPRVDPSGYLASVGGRPTASGVQVNAAQAMGISAFWRGVNLYARTIAALDLRVVREQPEGGFAPVREDVRYDLLRKKPNRWTTRQKFWEAIIAHALTQRYGGFAEIEWSARGSQVLGLHLMDPRATVPVINADRSVEYKINSSDRRLPAADVLHISGLGWDGISGYDIVGLAAETLGVARAQILYEGALYGNGANASGFFEMPGDPNPGQLAQMRAEIDRVHAGPSNGGKYGFLTGGTKFNQTSYSPNDAKMIEAKRQAVVEIGNLLNVPVHMLGVTDGATVGNFESQTLSFVTFGILPWLKTIEGEVESKLFSAQERNRGLTARHDIKSLLRGDTSAQANHDRALFDMGLASINELRSLNGMTYLDDPAADFHWVGVNNLAPIERWDGKPTQPGGNQTAAEPDADEPDPVAVAPDGEPEPTP